MNQQMALHHTEPTTHTSQSNWRQWLLCEDYSLSKEELTEFYEYFRQCNILFQKNERWDLIKQLYKLYFNAEDPKTSGKQWMKLGFQGQYPETDFRGGGVFSLKLILRFAQTNLATVREMQVDKGNFFFAITAINICFFMKKYFHLSDELIPQRDSNQYCNRRALKNFCRIIISQRFTFQQMHQIFLNYFYKDMWIASQKRNPQTLLQFNVLFAELEKRIRSTFQNHNIMSFHEFINTWRSQSN